MRAEARAALPELPAARAERYERDWELPADTARLFAFEPDWGDYFEEAATAAAPLEARPVANWVIELRGRLDGADPVVLAASPRRRSRGSPRLVAERRTTPGNARKVLDVLVAEGGDPAAIVEREGLGAMEDDGELAGDRRPGDRGQPRRRRAHQGRQREGDGRARRPDHEGDARPRRRRRGQPPDPRAAGHLAFREALKPPVAEPIRGACPGQRRDIARRWR